MLTAVKKLPIKTRVVLIILLASVVALLLESVAFVVYERFRVNQEITRDIGSLARVISNRSISSLTANDNQAAQETLADLKVEHAVVAACIYDVQGNIFARYDSGEERAFDFPVGGNLPAEVQSNNGHLYLSEPIMNNGLLMGHVFIRASLQSLNLRWQNFILFCGLIMVVTSFVILLIAIRLQRVVTEPFEQLTSSAQAIAANKGYRPRIPVESNDEFGLLARVFNGILEELENRDNALQQCNQRLATFDQHAQYPSELLALSSLQVGEGIERSGGKVDAYHKQLHRFREHYANATQDLQRLLLEDKDMAASEDYCNALKGVSGNIGANSLYQCITHICTNLRQEKLPDALEFEKMQALLQAVIADIDRLAITEKPESLSFKQDVSSAVLLAKTSMLLTALDEDLGATEPLLTELCAEVSGSEFESLVEAIAVQIDLFNIDQAAVLLTDLQQRLLTQS